MAKKIWKDAQHQGNANQNYSEEKKKKNYSEMPLSTPGMAIIKKSARNQ